MEIVKAGGESPQLFTGKVAIATPFYNLQAWSSYTQALVTTVQALEKCEIAYEYWPLHGDSYVQRARNTLCTKFMASDATDLFFIDSDESWDSMAFMRVLMCPFEIVGASYLMKNNWEAWTAQLKLVGDTPIGIPFEDAAILEAEFVPCGFMRIKKSAMQKMASAYPQLRYHDEGSEGRAAQEYFNFFECVVQDGVFCGEDVTFCRRWKALGEKLWVEPRATITHYGVKGWTGNLDETLRENMKGRDAYRAAA